VSTIPLTHPAAALCCCVPRMTSKKNGLVMSGISRAIVSVRPDSSERARGLGW
jgi:hypothetical protein